MLSFHIDSGYVVTWLGVFLRVSHSYPWCMDGNNRCKASDGPGGSTLELKLK